MWSISWDEEDLLHDYAAGESTDNDPEDGDDPLLENFNEPLFNGTQTTKAEAILMIQWNLVIKRSDITKPSYNKIILLVPALYISLFFTLI